MIEQHQPNLEGIDNQAPPKRTNLYAIVSRHAPRAIQVLVESMESKMPAVKMAAAKTLLAKCLPDIKALELGGDNGGPIQILVNAGNGFLPATLQLYAPPTGSAAEQPKEIQGASVASEGKENNNSDNGNSQAESS